MSERQSRLHNLHPLFKLNEVGVLRRCDEILDAVYHNNDRAEGPTLTVKDFSGAERVLQRLGVATRRNNASTYASLESKAGRQISPGLVSNLGTHARVCCRATGPKCDCCPLISFCGTGIAELPLNRGRSLRAVDLFAGAGGLSAGFRREGFQVLAAIEKDKHAAQSYRVNNPGVPVIEQDVRRVSPPQLLMALGWRRGDITAVISGPPCQGYSAAGPRKPMAKRNFLYQCVAAMAKGLGAPLVIMENVPGLRRVRGIGFTDRILDDFKRCKYASTAIEIDASKFGVPQRRTRLFFICTHPGLLTRPVVVRPPKSARKATVRGVLRGLPHPRSGKEGEEVLLRGKLIRNHRQMAHGYRVVRKIQKIKPGEGPISYRRLSGDQAHTVVAGHRALPVHPTEHRTITVREAARIQTMRDNFLFLGPHSEQPLQVANVVPYKVARAVARALRVALKRTASA